MCIYKLVKGESRRRDNEAFWCIKDMHELVLLRHENIKMRWQKYFSQLFNGTRGLEEVRETIDS